MTARQSVTRFIPDPPVALLLAIGALIRLVWDWRRDGAGSVGEARNIAIALATKGSFADAFYVGQGPTAHVTPSMVLVTAAIYRLFGWGEFGEAILSVIALALVFGCYWQGWRLFETLGAPRSARLLALFLLTLFPYNMNIEAANFRVWEGALSVLASLVLLRLLVALDRAPPSPRLFILPPLAAAIFFANPPLGIGVYAAGALFLCRNLSWPRFLAHGALWAACLAAIVGTWTLRNEAVLGRPIALRDNLGLELAIANYPGAADVPMTRARYWDRVKAIQPFNSPEALAQMKAAGGEVLYSQQLLIETKAWMRTHPGDVARLTLRHLREIYLPSPWMFENSTGSRFRYVQAVFFDMFAILGLAAALLALVRGPTGPRYVAILVLASPLPYALFQPILRYCWIIHVPLIYLAAALIFELHERLRRPQPLVTTGTNI